MRIGDPVAAAIDGLDGAQANAHMASQGAALDRHDYRQAEAYWRCLKAVASPEVAAQAQHNIDMIESFTAKSQREQSR
ncbi:hypothetical protein [Paraburkholderia atlantica]|uniref:hypothetical protein n=1 Tax=Paraburkholderia atlantica TaxID=2654982 RepID=UPI0001BF37AF|nr:hypothetical protein [Paraburkholderia atlantica]MBB5507740.1 hypothetical protein [Paraburkholderia atlantica]